ncbi:hypothetical protein JTE90_019777 [Oedothorax gibbosus]|uniref:Uncharacterized protein n=1 Tax=Oedothorax gibbosus TaxID=931172 RepID=A0AAV6TUG1_9ARAC|nr:hypothetical protein JTE90_019777 [Oedothorax gibbosus]
MEFHAIFVVLPRAESWVQLDYVVHLINPGGFLIMCNALVKMQKTSIKQGTVLINNSAVTRNYHWCLFLNSSAMTHNYRSRSSNGFTMALNLHRCPVLNESAMTDYYHRCLFLNSLAMTHNYQRYQIFK